MTLQPWLEVARPRPDIADGSFDESLFAADLGLVARGSGPADYRDPLAFCEKTYLTKNLEAVLVELGRRLGGDPAAAGVYRLQTEFGGGKTHTLLAAYHLFGSPDSIAATDIAKELAPLLPGERIPKAKVVVLDGSALTVGAPDIAEDGSKRWTMLGYLAHGLGGEAAWEAVATQDRDMLGSSTVQLVELLRAHTPCLILMDEVLEYLNKGLTVSTHDGNLASTTLTLIKELTSAVANTPGAALLATLTSSRMEDYAEVAGQEMQDRLSKIVGRSENIVTPVEGDDIFPILHRRLFTSVGA
nr:ATP-binding protein [Actinomycetota bacterium]